MWIDIGLGLAPTAGTPSFGGGGYKPMEHYQTNVPLSRLGSQKSRVLAYQGAKGALSRAQSVMDTTPHDPEAKRRAMEALSTAEGGMRKHPGLDLTEFRRGAIELLGRRQWIGETGGGYEPVPDPGARHVSRSDRARIERFERIAGPTPEWEMQAVPTDWSGPTFGDGTTDPVYTGDSSRVVYGGKAPYSMSSNKDEGDVVVKEEKSTKEALIDNLTLVSLVLGIIAFFR